MDRTKGRYLEQFLTAYTSVLIKPEAFVTRRAQRVVDLLNDHGFVPIAWAPTTFTRHMLREFWRHKSTGLSEAQVRLVDLFLTRSPSLYILLRNDGAHPGDTATQRLSSIKGAARVSRRRPNDLRTQLDIEYPILSYIHAPDTETDLVHELGVFLDCRERVTLLHHTSPSRDITSQILRMTAAVQTHDLSFSNAFQRVTKRCRGLVKDTSGDLSIVAGRFLAEPRQAWIELLDHEIFIECHKARWDLVVVGAHFAAALDCPDCANNPKLGHNDDLQPHSPTLHPGATP